MLVEMPMDALEQAAAVGIRCFDEHGNARARGLDGPT
jgi:hypothetical protein